MDEKSANDYSMQHTSPEDEILHELYRETNLTTVYPRMISGHLQGKLLEMVSYMIKPSRILEIGTFTGYSAICLAKGLAPQGILHTIDINDELAERAQYFFRQSGMEKKIILHIGDACEVIPRLNESFDLVFIDGDKEQYLDYYNIVFPVLKTGGFILADNVLWGGKVLPGSADNDKETRCIRDFNEYIKNDRRVDKMMLPFRDGIFILRKISN